MENNTQVSLPVNAALLCLPIWLEITLGFFSEKYVPFVEDDTRN